MRIGIDMIGVQAPESRGRGIGRYTRNLVSTLADVDRENEYFLYFYDGLPQDRIASANNVFRRYLSACDAKGRRSASLEHLARTNPDDLHLLLFTSPFGTFQGYGIPAKPLNGLRVASLLYDVIPALFQQRYLGDARVARWYYRTLDILQRYDLILTISSATKADYERLAPDCGQVVADIGCASQARFFRPALTQHDSPGARRTLESLGINQPFVFNLGGGLEWRKNFDGLIDAFRLLPEALRRSHQLVVTCALGEQEAASMRARAASCGVGDRVVLTGAVSDSTLRTLYQRSAAFVFPSIYEGFGLPILEALHCAAPVIAGNNSSQVEVVGDAGLLVNVHDPADIAAKLAQILQDRGLADQLRTRAPRQARKFCWQQTARRARDAFRRVVGRRQPQARSSPPRRRPKPRIAYFSPLPPKPSGISDYSVQLLGELKHHFSIDVFHDAGYVPHGSLASSEMRYYDYRLYPRYHTVLDYYATLYQMGNSEYHRFVYETLQRHPGIVTLHDLSLANYHRWYACCPGVGTDHLRRELEYEGWDRLPEIAALLRDCAGDRRQIFETCVRKRIYLNRRILQDATKIVVHSPWCIEQLETHCPESARRAAVIPQGTLPQKLSWTQRQAVRARYGVPRDAFVCASFGSLHPTKMNLEAVAAFASLGRDHPRALFLFVGSDMTDGQMRAKVHELGLAGQVRFLGYQPNFEQFRELCGVADVAVNLRRPPTNGETSAALLLLLGAGVPTVVTDVDTMSDYPDNVVVKIPWGDRVVDALKSRLARLACDRRWREQLGSAARDYVSDHHRWSRVAALYAALIDDVSEQRTGRNKGASSHPCPASHATQLLCRELSAQQHDSNEPRVIGPLRRPIPLRGEGFVEENTGRDSAERPLTSGSREEAQ